MRNSSGSKFSLGSAFGKKSDRQPSYSGNPANDFGAPQPAGGYAPNGGHGGFGQGGYGGSGNAGGAGQYDAPDSPGAASGGHKPGGSGGGFKLGKSIAHQSFLPALSNKDVRSLQDVISTEKGVLTNLEKLSVEQQKAASALPPYGQQEGPDLSDILTQSSQLLNYLSSSLNVYAEREISLRGCYKKIREREEAFADLRSRRRNTGGKAEQAQRKLEKMGPENKALQGQTELLERLRNEMRSMDTEIAREESAIGDFKRQVIKEILSFKFGGLEELGEKLCIIGEMGKLVLEEIPLEETPPGYGRAPYGGFSKTEYAVEEAGRCLGQVKYTHAETALKPSHLPHAQHLPQGHGHADLPRQESIAAAEEFAHFPGNQASPEQQARPPYQNMAAPRLPSFGANGPSGGGGLGSPGMVGGQRAPGGPGGPGGYGLDENPYGGISGEEYPDRRQTLWQGPEDGSPYAPGRQGPPVPAHDQVQGQGAVPAVGHRQSDGIEYAQARIASMYGQPGPAPGQQDRDGFVPTPNNPHQHTPSPGPAGQIEEGQGYEYEQQQDLERQNQQEQAAWRDQPSHPPSTHQSPRNPQELQIGQAIAPGQQPPWQPLNVHRAPSPAPQHPGQPRTPNINEPPAATEAGYDAAPAPPNAPVRVGTPAATATPDLLPPPNLAQLAARAPTPGTDGGYHTPSESPDMMPPSIQPPSLPSTLDTNQPTQDRSSPAPAASYTNSSNGPPVLSNLPPMSPILPSPGGKMSAGAFRKAVPRRSEGSVGPEGSGQGQDEMSRVVSGGGRRLPLPPGAYPGPSQEVGGSSAPAVPGGWQDEKRALAARGQGAFEDAREEGEAPPTYVPQREEESLR